MTVSPPIPVIQPAPAKRRALSVTSLIVVPLKQHLGCCIIVPTAVKVAGAAGIIGGFAALSTQAHIYLSFGLAPVLVWLCLALEDRFHDWQHARGHYSAGRVHAHETDCAVCEPCPVSHTRRGFWRRYGLNLAVAYGVIGLIELFHSHAP